MQRFVELLISGQIDTSDHIRNLRHEVLWNELQKKIHYLLTNPKYKELNLDMEKPLKDDEGGVASDSQSLPT